MKFTPPATINSIYQNSDTTSNKKTPRTGSYLPKKVGTTDIAPIPKKEQPPQEQDTYKRDSATGKLVKTKSPMYKDEPRKPGQPLPKKPKVEPKKVGGNPRFGGKHTFQ